MDKYIRTVTRQKRRERRRKMRVKLCLLCMLAGFVLGAVICLAVVNMGM